MSKTSKGRERKGRKERGKKEGKGEGS